MFKKRLAIVTTLLMLLAPGSVVFASFNAQMDKMFGSMVNVTSPTGYMDQSRGHLSGGQVTLKQKIVKAEFVHFDPPRIDAGCGGINAFSGSFSFISADEFTQILRSIGSNAITYGFKLAVSNLCPSCGVVMEELRKAMALMNTLAKDSCEVAQVGVDWIGEQMPSIQGNMLEKAVASIGVKKGLVPDSFTFLDDFRKPKATSQDMSSEDLKDIMGNIAWVVMNKRGDNSKKFLDSMENDSQGMAETIMSLTGTLVVKKAESGEAKAQLDVTPYSNSISLKDLVGEEKGKRELTLWSCAGQTSGEIHTQCLKPVEKPNSTITTMLERVKLVLFGEEGGVRGIVQQYAAAEGDLTEEQKGFMELAPLHGKRLRDLAVLSPSAARIYAEKAASKIALDLTVELMEATLRQLRAVAAVHKNASAASFLATLDKLGNQVREQEASMAEQLMTEDTVAKMYDELKKYGDLSRLAEFASEASQEEAAARK